MLNYTEFLLKAGQDDRILRVGDEEFDQTSWVISDIKGRRVSLNGLSRILATTRLGRPKIGPKDEAKNEA